MVVLVVIVAVVVVKSEGVDVSSSVWLWAYDRTA